MKEILHEVLGYITLILETIGVLAIALGTLRALIICGIKRDYAQLRKDIGRSILLGLEILVGADIISTVTTAPELNKIFALAIIVLIRIVLELSLQVEIEGRFPWQQNKQSEV